MHQLQLGGISFEPSEDPLWTDCGHHDPNKHADTRLGPYPITHLTQHFFLQLIGKRGEGKGGSIDKPVVPV